MMYDSIIVATNVNFTKGAVAFTHGKALQSIERQDIDDWLKEAKLRRYHLRQLPE